jgi:O-antigen/teichoic acid export membrane protein
MTDAGRGLFARLLAGFSAQGLAIAVRLVQQIVMVPIFLGAWSTALYQDWLILTAATGFLGLLDLGLHNYLASRLLVTWSQGAREDFHRTFHIGLGLYAVILVLAAAPVVVLAWAATAFSWLEFGGASPSAAMGAILGMAAYTLIAMPEGMVISVYWARGDVARGVNFATFGALFDTTAAGIALWLGAPPAIVALVYAGAVCFVWLCLWFDQTRRYPDLRYRLIRPSRRDLAELIPKAADYLAIPLAQSALVQGSVIILGAIAGTAAGAPVVVFATLRTLANLVRQAVNQTGQVASAEMTRLHAAGDRDQLGRLYLASARLLGGAGGLMAGAVLAVAPSFLAIWTLGKVGYDAWVFTAFLCGIVLTLPGQLAALVLFVSNQPRALMACTVAQAVVGTLLSLPAAQFWGAAGVAWVLALTEICTVGLLPWQAGRAMGLAVVRPVVTSLAAAGAGAAIGYAVAILGLAVIGNQKLGQLTLVGAAWCVVIAWPAYLLLLAPQHRLRLRTWIAAASKAGVKRSP